MKEFGKFLAGAGVATGVWGQSPALSWPDVVTQPALLEAMATSTLSPSSLFFLLPSDLRTTRKWNCILLRKYMVIPKTFIKHLLWARHCSRQCATKKKKTHKKFPYPEKLTLYWEKQTVSRIKN